MSGGTSRDRRARGIDDWLSERASERRAAGLERRLPDPSADDVVDLAGNDYLGFARDPRVVKAASAAAEAWGAGAGASRLVTGTLAVHQALETALAEWTGRTAAVALSTGYHANLAAVTALTDEDTVIVSDAHVHASLIDACRLSRGTVRVVAHNDVAAVDAALRERSRPRALVVVESIYSVLGDAAPLAELAAICARHEAVLLVDEAHGIGVAGEGGRGLVHEAGLSDAGDVVVTATLSKALGSQGGAILGSPAVIDQVVNTARPFIYDTGLAPAAAGAATEALAILASDDAGGTSLHEAKRSAWGTVARLRQVAQALGARVGASPAGAVMSVPMPGPAEALAAQAQCRASGVLVGCFRPPSTPDGSSRLRITASARLSDADLARALDVLGEVLA
ncbi:MAG TPA: 8-amino-7-oxononanoate synthase [Aeromicrobium sp.]|nr:8-amino-7-oxononanoate synthase [Aeromicrobium sp.]